MNPSQNSLVKRGACVLFALIGLFILALRASSAEDGSKSNFLLIVTDDHGAEVVLGATPDGGVWCIGLDRAQPDLLADIPWSSASTGDALRNRADALGLNRVEVAPWYDCDLQEDLDALVDRLRDRPGAATMTRRLLHQTDPDPE